LFKHTDCIQIQEGVREERLNPHLDESGFSATSTVFIYSESLVSSTEIMQWQGISHDIQLQLLWVFFLSYTETAWNWSPRPFQNKKEKKI